MYEGPCGGEGCIVPVTISGYSVYMNDIPALTFARIRYLMERVFNFNGGHMSITEPEAKLQLSLLNLNVMELDRIDLITQLTNFGLPQEVITRIGELWEKVQMIGGQAIHIGKIVVAEIMKFIKENKHLAVGLALGAAVGALISMVPFIGPLLAPLATAVSMFVGAIAGYRIDQGRKPNSGVIGVTQEQIMIAKKFFELFANIFIALKEEFSGG